VKCDGSDTQMNNDAKGFVRYETFFWGGAGGFEATFHNQTCSKKVLSFRRNNVSNTTQHSHKLCIFKHATTRLRIRHI